MSNVTKCEECGSTNLEDYKGSLELEHETGIQTEVEINGFECKDCGEITIPDEQAIALIEHLTSLVDDADKIDTSTYE